jgi:hypothetical protein
MATMNNIVFALYRLAASVNNETMAKTRIRYKDDPMELIELLLPLLEKKECQPDDQRKHERQSQKVGALKLRRVRDTKISFVGS